jgi:hypothetical protein
MNQRLSVCPFEDCPTGDEHFSQHELILHLCNEHSPSPIPPIVPDELRWQCPQCEARMVTGERMKAHMNKVAAGLDCASLLKGGRGQAFDAKVRGLIDILVNYPKKTYTCWSLRGW